MTTNPKWEKFKSIVVTRLIWFCLGMIFGVSGTVTIT